jgi:hypothetical protein
MLLPANEGMGVHTAMSLRTRRKGPSSISLQLRLSLMSDPQLQDYKPPLMFTTIPINGVNSKTLINSRPSDDFVGTHFVNVNRLSMKKRESLVSIRQDVKGSKPKSNVATTLKVSFGEWNKPLTAHVAGLAGYDAIIGAPTLTDGDAVI